MKRKGIVTVELALCTAFIIVPMGGIGLLVCKGGFRKARCELAASVATIKLQQGSSVADAAAAGQTIMDTIGGSFAVNTDNVVASSSVSVFSRTIPIITEIPRVD